MAIATTTVTGQPIKVAPMPSQITIYAPDGSPHKCAPIDAREILASGNGYTAEPPAPKVEDEQQPEQQPIISDGVATAEPAAIAETGQSDDSGSESGSKAATVSKGRRTRK